MTGSRLEKWIVHADWLGSRGYEEAARSVTHAIRWATGIEQDAFGLRVLLDVGHHVVALRLINGGSYAIGSPYSEGGRYRSAVEPEQHLVEIPSFWLAEAPVTRHLWTSRGRTAQHKASNGNCPIAGVCLAHAESFVQELRSELGAPVRLPTELEWEVACRAGSFTSTWVGEPEILGPFNSPQLGSIAWYGGNAVASAETGYPRQWATGKEVPHAFSGLQRVRQKPPNPWGLYDMLGNVYEVCRQSRVFDYPDVGKEVVRGGCWASHASDIRASHRAFLRPRSSRATSFVGFRMAVTA